MNPTYTKTHFDFSELPWLTSPRKRLDLEAVALGLIRIPANEGYSFTHTHRKQEEVYIVIEGNGTLLVDEELVPLIPGDIIRVSATARRALKAGDMELFVICSGAVPMGYPENPNSRYLIDDGIPDYDDIPPWYEGRKDIEEKNKQLQKRMYLSLQKRNLRNDSGDDNS